MRVLIADRNARLLESISLTFAHQFKIHTANTRKHCVDLLRQGEFDLVVVCEKLADGPGLQLLGKIARNAPDTLRVFAAKRARLRFLKDKLGPFGLFRTLPYPLEARGLLSTLTLARAGLEESDVPAPSIGAPRQPQPASRPPRIEPPSPPTVRQLPDEAAHSQAVAAILARLQPPQLVPPKPARSA
jgi:DNA-binding NtrC family response regulator